MTNPVAIVTILLVTNQCITLMPSGEERFVKSIVSEIHTAQYTNSGIMETLSRTNAIATNTIREVWCQAPLLRNPLSIKDLPMPPVRN